MRSARASVLLAGLVLCSPGGAVAQVRPPPVLDLRVRATEYLGPGRELEPPGGLGEIRIAFFGPADPAHPEWGDAWRGAALAVEEANATGAARLPFRLLGAWSESPWGSGVADLAKLVYQQGVWGVLGGVDGVTTHLAEQVAVKARLPLVSPGGTDPSVNYTSVPWMFSLLPTDDRIAPLLADELAGPEGAWALVTTADHDAAAGWRALRAAMAKRRTRAPLLHLVLPSGADPGRAVDEVARSGAHAVLVLAGAADSAALVRGLRAGGFAGRIAGGAAIGRRLFRERAGPAAQGVAFPLLFDVERPEARGFVRRFEQRWGERPDYLAAHAYDGARLLMAAVGRAGMNRARIRDALVELAPWPGATGPVTWDATGRNVRPVVMSRTKGGERGTGSAGDDRQHAANR